MIPGIIFICSCFHAPSPSYLRPGHPEWPVSWLSGVPGDSLESHISRFRQQGIGCAGIDVREAAGRETGILALCRKTGMKLFLQIDPKLVLAETRNSVPQAQPDSGIGIPETIGPRIGQILKAWRETGETAFPVDMIPAVQFGTVKPDSTGTDPVIGSDVPIRMIEQAVQRIVPDMLVLWPENEFRVSQPPAGKGTFVSGHTTVVSPWIAWPAGPADLKEIRNRLVKSRNMARYQNALFIPQLDFRHFPPDREYGAAQDSLTAVMISLHADAIIWRGVPVHRLDHLTSFQSRVQTGTPAQKSSDSLSIF